MPCELTGSVEYALASATFDVKSDAREDSADVEPRARRVDEELEASGRCDDELFVVVDEDWTHRVVNLRALSPTVGAKCRGMNRR